MRSRTVDISMILYILAIRFIANENSLYYEEASVKQARIRVVLVCYFIM